MPTSSQYSPNDTTDLVATIASGQTVSNPVDMGGVDLLGLFIPSTFDGTTLYVDASPDNGVTWFRCQSAGSDYALTAAPNKFCPIENVATLAGTRTIRLVAATTQAGTDSVIVLSARPV